MLALPFYFALIITFGLAAGEKIFGGKVPDWFLHQFKDSLLDLFPGALNLAFYSIATLELLTFALLVLGLFFSITKKSMARSFLESGVFVAQITFIALSFGQRLTHQYEAAGSLFVYAVLTFIAARMASVSA